MRIRSVVALVISMAICLAVGISASLVTAPSVRAWYPQIDKPSWTPPDAVFGPVWTVLYLLMGLSAWLIWRDATGRSRRSALLIFTAQLALNGAWSLLFFGLRSPGLAALEIVLLWAAIVGTILVFVRINRVAAAFLFPYLLWVSFAAALNLSIWNLNR
jgi:tryptophan-rich sensory protein